jgi:hypothetical protein
MPRQMPIQPPLYATELVDTERESATTCLRPITLARHVAARVIQLRARACELIAAETLPTELGAGHAKPCRSAGRDASRVRDLVVADADKCFARQDAVAEVVRETSGVGPVRDGRGGVGAGGGG